MYTARYALICSAENCESWLRRLVSSLTHRRMGFDNRSVCLRFVVQKVSLSKVSLPVLLSSPVSIIPPTLHTHSFTYHPHYIMFLSQHFCSPVSTIPPTLHTHLVPSRRNGRSLGTFQMQRSFRNRETVDMKVLSLSFKV